MDSFSPQLAAFWPAGSSGRHVEEEDSAAALRDAQQIALEELEERVNAARSVI